MAKYQLTQEQKDMLKSIAKGLRDGSVMTTWLYTPQIGREYTELEGFPGANELKWEVTDLRVFEKFNFISSNQQDKYTREYFVHKQVIFDAVDTDFEMPVLPSQSGQVQNIHINGVNNSNVNIGWNLSQIQQAIGAMHNVEEDDKKELQKKIEELSAELQKLQETHPDEARAVTKQLGRVVEDMAEEEPDKEDVDSSLERLQKAATNLMAISPTVYTLAIGFVQFLRQIQS